MFPAPRVVAPRKQFDVSGYTITEKDVDLTPKDTIADIEAEHFCYRVPDRTAIKLKKGMRFFLYIATSGPTQITDGIVRLYKATVDKVTRRKHIAVASPDELDAGGTPEDRQNQYTLKNDAVIGSKEYLICTVDAAEIADDAQLKVRIDCIKVMEMD